MKTRLQILFLIIAAVSFGLSICTSSVAQDVPHQMPEPSPTPTPKATPQPAPKQTASPTPTPKPRDMNMPGMNMPTPSPTPPNNPSTGGGQKTLDNLSPEKDFGEPVADDERFGSTLFDVLEFRPGKGGDADFRWDIEGWYGTDKNRFFYKSEGERNTAFKADYDIDLQLLYSRLISPYFTLFYLSFPITAEFEAKRRRISDAELDRSGGKHFPLKKTFARLSQSESGWDRRRPAARSRRFQKNSGQT